MDTRRTHPMTSDEPLLLTPGPLTVSESTRQAMNRNWGARDPIFIEMTARLRHRLCELAGGGPGYTCVPIQGSGTFAVEAMLGTLVGPGDKLLVLANGAYGRRMAEMCARMGRDHTILESAEDTPPDPLRVEAALAADDAITHVAVVQCETTTGIVNPVAEIAAIVAASGRSLLVDAMSAFGALPLDAASLPCQALAASANKCLEGVPGVAFVIARADALAAAGDNAPSLSLDLAGQWRGFEANGQWRFTAPTQVVAALDQALDEHAAEGGVAGRGARYRRNRDVLVEGMRAMGFETYLPDAVQAPIIVTFHSPADPNFDFEAFYAALARRGYLIYPGKLTRADTFRIGCIGHIGEAEIRGALDAVREVLDELGVKQRGKRAA